MFGPDFERAVWVSVYLIAAALAIGSLGLGFLLGGLLWPWR